MVKLNAQQWLEKWGRKMNGAGPDITAGIDRVKTAPGQLAAQAKALFVQRLMESINNGTWEKNVAAVPLEQWKDAMKTKGMPRIAQGVTMAQKNKSGIISELLSAVDQASTEAKA